MRKWCSWSLPYPLTENRFSFKACTIQPQEIVAWIGFDFCLFVFDSQYESPKQNWSQEKQWQLQLEISDIFCWKVSHYIKIAQT